MTEGKIFKNFRSIIDFVQLLDFQQQQKNSYYQGLRTSILSSKSKRHFVPILFDLFQYRQLLPFSLNIFSSWFYDITLSRYFDSFFPINLQMSLCPVLYPQGDQSHGLNTTLYAEDSQICLWPRLLSEPLSDVSV